MIEQQWQLRGMTFSGLRWREGAAGPLTVLLHGFLDHAGAWERVAEALPGDCVALDHRGHGRSAHNPIGSSYVFADYLADLDALIDGLSPARPVRLVGHSMGGTIASLYAGARPDRVCALVSLDGLGLADGVSSPAVVDLDPVSDRLVRFLDGVRSPPRNRALPSLLAAQERLEAAHPRLGPQWAARLAERGTRPAPSPAVSGSVVWSFDAMHRVRSPIPYRHEHHIPLLRRILCPVLSVRPAMTMFQHDDVAALEAAIARLSTVVVPNTSHMMHFEEPEAISGHIREFWATIPAL